MAFSLQFLVRPQRPPSFAALPDEGLRTRQADRSRTPSLPAHRARAAWQQPLALPRSGSPSTPVRGLPQPSTPRAPRKSSVPLLQTPEPGTPKPRWLFRSTSPPPAPSKSRKLRDFAEDVQIALDERSEPLLSMTLCFQHGQECRGNHVLHEAVKAGNLGALSMLLASGHRCLEDPCGATRPLMLAVQISGTEDDVGFQMVQLLLQHGAAINAPAADADAETALHRAVAHGHLAMAKLLLAHGADSNSPNGSDRTPLHGACQPPAWSSAEDAERLVKLLLEHGADPRVRDFLGQKPAHHMAYEAVRLGDMRRRIEQLLEREEHWLQRRAAILTRGHGTGCNDHPLTCLPEALFRTIVHNL
mmetsp:Transcript_108305/g.345896  ORF Transcript_108305/g.345896 Transcript_108305/m.345896 type:complete len:360 (-) Transcript_108305:354-1433(-)